LGRKRRIGNFIGEGKFLPGREAYDARKRQLLLGEIVASDNQLLLTIL